jgi:hypothetical protein
MKNKFLLLTIFCLGLFGLNSCTDEDNFRLQAPETVEDLTITNGLQSEYILIEETFTNIAERFTWESPDFQVQSNVAYDLEYSVDGLFENPQLIANTSENQVSVTIQQLWNIAVDNLGLEANTDNDSGELFFRVKADLGTPQAENSPTSISSTQVLFVRLIESGGEIPKTDLFLVGSATAADWNNNNNNPPIVRDPENPNAYSFTGRFLGNPNEFKLLEIRGQWQPQWGLDNGIFISSDDLGSDPGNYGVSGGEGYYTLTVNTEEGTHDLVPFDDSASPNYGSVGIIGFGTTGSDDGWNQDIDLTQSSFDPHLWYINGMTLFDGEVKFRADNDWSVNWGANTALTGFGTQDGPNVPVVAGTYDIWFNDIDGTYVLVPLGE